MIDYGQMTIGLKLGFETIFSNPEHRQWRAMPLYIKKLVMIDEQPPQDLCNRIVRDFQSERIILFGSYAYGNTTPDSDVDILNPAFPIDLLAWPDDTERRYREGDPLNREALNCGKALYEQHRCIANLI